MRFKGFVGGGRGEGRGPGMGRIGVLMGFLGVPLIKGGGSGGVFNGFLEVSGGFYGGF